MEKLNPDVLSEISSRLPTKSVLQCREVCKLWRSLFGKPRPGTLFVNRRNYFGPADLYFIEQSSDQKTEKHQNFYKTVTKISRIDTEHSYFEFVGSCNGLICYNDYESKVSDFMYVSNPITGERIRLPQMGAYFVCAGFGYCQETDMYKVVALSNIVNGKRRVQVYTLGDGSVWRDKPKTTYTCGKQGVFANGALHWLESDLMHTKYNCHIVAFDLADETFRSLPPPPCHIPSSSCTKVLGILEGNLCLLLSYFKEQGECMMDIWVFKKKNLNKCRCSSRLNENTWFRVFSRKWDAGSTHKCRPLYLTKSEILLFDYGVLSCYDRNDKNLTRLWYADGARGDVKAIPRMNSLISLKDFGNELVVC